MKTFSRLQHPSSPPPLPVTARLDLRTIYQRHGDFVWLMLQRLGVRPSDLDDVAQDVFVVVHRRLSTFDGRARVETWLYGICARLAANYRRRRQWKREVLSGSSDDERPSGGATPDEMFVRREEQEQAERALRKLSVQKRAVFVMAEIEGLSCGEIAELMGVPLGTVYSRLHAARRGIEVALARDTRRARSRPDKGTRRG